MTKFELKDYVFSKIKFCEVQIISTSPGGIEVAIVAADLLGESPTSNGLFLFQKNEHGWCPVDYVLPPAWHYGTSCKSRFNLNWSESPSDGLTQLKIVANRTCYLPLDQEEKDAGESDIDSMECQHVVFEAEYSNLVLRNRVDSGESCDIE